MVAALGGLDCDMRGAPGALRHRCRRTPEDWGVAVVTHIDGLGWKLQAIPAIVVPRDPSLGHVMTLLGS